jgi:nucleoside-diphosphate-sugar epimerase
MTQTALVVGASGIVGSAITQLLIDNQWQVAALSRHPSQAQGVIPVAADLQDPASLARALADLKATHVFITTWSRQATEAENIRVNAAMVRNVLDANRLFRPCFKYSKAEVLLMDLRQPGEFTDDLFAHSQPVTADKVMTVLDEINGLWGKGVLRLASVPAAPDWAMRRELTSQSYTTKVDQLWTVMAR